MEGVDASLLARYKIKSWSLRYFFTQSLEGHALLLKEVKLCLGREWAKLIRKSRGFEDKSKDGTQRGQQQQDYLSIFLTSSSSRAPTASTFCKQSGLVIPSQAEVQVEVHVEDHDEDNRATSLKYGIVVLSKLAHVLALWGPSFALDISLDLQMSRSFVITCYFQLATFFFIGLIVAKRIIEPSLVQIFGKIAPSVMQVFTMSVLFSLICYLLYTLVSCAYIIYQRNFIQDFFLYRCTMITLPRAYQRRKIVILTLALYAFAFISVPLYVLLSLYYDVEQPQIWPHLSLGWFRVAKWATIAFTSFSASLLSSCGILIPLMTCFLMLASARHLKNIMQKQLVRYRRAAAAAVDDNQREPSGGKVQSSSRLEALLDDRTRKTIEDYSCYTLTMDWPEMVDTRKKRSAHSQTSPFKLFPAPSATTSASASSSSATTTCCTSFSSPLARSTDQSIAIATVDRAGQRSRLSASASGLLFVYKNLLKNMSEIKQMIRLWESKFANFHLIYTLINCLIVAQWITVAFTEARGRQLGDVGAAAGTSGGARESTRAITAVRSYLLSPFVVRIIGGVLTFVISNIYIMLWCDCLSRRMIKIRAQLFKMNIDLTSSHVLSRGAPLEICGGSCCGCCCGGATPGGSAARQHQNHQQRLRGAPDRPTLGQYAEIDQIWSLYDQLDRLASTTLFRFSSDTYYTKRCLLAIFGRSVSVLLLFIQIIEMYSYV